MAGTCVAPPCLSCCVQLLWSARVAFACNGTCVAPPCLSCCEQLLWSARAAFAGDGPGSLPTTGWLACLWLALHGRASPGQTSVSWGVRSPCFQLTRSLRKPSSPPTAHPPSRLVVSLIFSTCIPATPAPPLAPHCCSLYALYWRTAD